MDQAEITARVRERFGSRIIEEYAFRGQHAVTIRPADLRELLLFLRDTAGLDFEWLVDLAGVDYLGYDEREWRFEVVYQMLSLKQNHRFRVKVAVESDAVSVPSVWDLWGIANWMEREVFDLYGVRFDNHPNLRRILCHDEFVGHALRKDYPKNRRQKLSKPSESVLCDSSEIA